MKTKTVFYTPYLHIMLALAVFVVFAFVADSPLTIFRGLERILRSRSMLQTDYIAVGGIGATLLNAALTGLISTLLMARSGVKPNGSTLMAIWLMIGFSFFGKNIFNILPITAGVWIYAKFQREPFKNYSLISLLSSTLAPVVGEFAFLGKFPPLVEMLLGLAAGLACGFLMPIISAATNAVHGGYNLYNAGFAGGLIAVFLAAFCDSAGIELERPALWSWGNDRFLAIFLLCIMCGWLLIGLIGKNRRENVAGCKKILTHSGRLISDFYLLYGEAVYINMGVLGIAGMAITLLLGAPLNGVTLAGIFTMMAFGSFGKHLRNCLPVMAGAVIAAALNQYPFVGPVNICAILFCTGLAPLAGQYGWAWGVVAGVLHTTIVAHAGSITGGFNLYNNGFAGGFVALLLLPIILAFKRGSKRNDA